jgi:hypothetical protein
LRGGKVADGRSPAFLFRPAAMKSLRAISLTPSPDGKAPPHHEAEDLPSSALHVLFFYPPGKGTELPPPA